ncbi:MAG: PilZ domain-containing protein, partial [Candidatus Eremiobacteraeota bacterium]|nr:PilZ domain-containing protein [Candidatus Eremiobacteraeota bacterium]
MADKQGPMLRRLLTTIRDFFLPRKARLQDPAERRQLVRVRCRIPIQIRVGERTISGWVVDMGVQGIRVRTGEGLKKGQAVAIRATVSQQSSQAWVNCRIMWARPVENGKHYLAGARFHETRENLRRTWVHRLLRELGLNENSLRERREFIRVNGRVPVRMQSLRDGGPVQADE